MPINYNKLWKLLSDRKLMKKELRAMVDISSNTLAKMRKDETISGEVIVKAVPRYIVMLETSWKLYRMKVLNNGRALMQSLYWRIEL